MREVDLPAADLSALSEIIGPERTRALQRRAADVAARLGGRTVWNINATASGGGVAEMLAMEVPYARALGITTRWVVIDGDPDFFRITKRIHNRLHGSAGDGGPLGPAERTHYDAVLSRDAEQLLRWMVPGDVVLLHDPQPLGLATALSDAGFPCVWRCHVGTDEPSEMARDAWAFLRPDVERCARTVFSRRPYVPPEVPGERVALIMPCIDPLSPKNREVPADLAGDVLRWAGFAPGAPSREPGHPLIVVGPVDPAPDGAPLVVQVSRWDRLKDMVGVMRAFADHVVPAVDAAHLALVGPAAIGVSDDPEGAAVWDECCQVWTQLPLAARERIRLVALPMDDVTENAVMVNAIQRRAAVVVQKSLVEGFGLTVSEAMWKQRPVIASAVGGIADQIEDGRHGLLLPDPTDLEGLGARIVRVLEDPGLAARLGANARDRVRTHFLPDRSLLDWGEILLEAAAP